MDEKVERPDVTGVSVSERFAEVWRLTCARWGLDPERPQKMRRDVIRKLRMEGGRLVELKFVRVTERGETRVRVRGCRLRPESSG